MDIETLDKLAHQAMTLELSGNRNLDRWNVYPMYHGREGYYKFLMLLTRTMQPKVCVELGVYMGFGLAHMAVGNPKSVCIGIDKNYHPDVRQVVGDNYPNTMLLSGDTIELAPDVKSVADSLGAKIGLLYVDALHKQEQVEKEIDTYYPLMEKGGVICFDDLNALDGFWDNLVMDKVRLDFLHDAKEYGGIVGFGAAIV